MKKHGKYLLVAALVVVGFLTEKKMMSKKIVAGKPMVNLVSNPVPTIIPTLTPKPADLAELEKKYGPCVKVAVLMYHHIEESQKAAKNNQTHLAVSPEFFQKQMEYLKVRGYTVIGPGELVAALDGGSKLPTKTAMITLDDAYEDNYTNAFPVLKNYGYKATIFTPTGLVTVADYLTWDQIREMAGSGLLYFGNHTWSHHSSAGPIAEIKREIGIADSQLAENGLNSAKVFAYPYGNPSADALKVLTDLKYSLAFTTAHGDIMCKGQRLTLPRIRVGNAPLSSYGL